MVEEPYPLCACSSLVERLSDKEEVEGSIPSTRTGLKGGEVEGSIPSVPPL